MFDLHLDQKVYLLTRSFPLMNFTATQTVLPCLPKHKWFARSDYLGLVKFGTGLFWGAVCQQKVLQVKLSVTWFLPGLSRKTEYFHLRPTQCLTRFVLSLLKTLPQAPPSPSVSFTDGETNNRDLGYSWRVGGIQEDNEMDDWGVRLLD